MQWVTFAIQLLPMLLELIKQVQILLPHGEGPLKKALVMEQARMVVADSPLPPEQQQKVLVVADKVIDATVAVKNATEWKGANGHDQQAA